MKAWNIDANTINTGEIHSNELNNLMVITKEIRDFLSPETKKMFIVAPKGVGKTFLLKVKSQIFRDTSSGYKFIPEETLCESFTSNDISFSENDILKFTERSTWNKTWELCLYTLILRIFKSKEIPAEILNVIGEETGALNEILGAFLQVRSNIDKLHSLVALKLKPAVRKLRENSSANQIAVFIDNIDESFDSYVGFTAQIEGKLKASSIWINAQLSLLSVARDICRTNHHIKIFSTIRSEAYKNFFDPLKLQIDDLCVFLEYTKDEIRDIFYKNIKLTPKEELFKSDGNNPIIDLFGYDTIPHKFIQDDFGLKKMENVFDFIYRHTYARPRDIVLMGKSIVEKVSPDQRHNTIKVGTVINEQSYKLFEQLKNETIPVFEDEVFEKFCLRIKSNVIKYEDAYKIYQEFKDEGFPNVFSYFYRLGLIGIVESDLNNESNPGGELKQSFLPVGQYTLTSESIPVFQYFVLHPSLNKKMKQIYDVGFYDRFNIMGYDYPFYPQKINRIENHFHFGVDRDSLTAILPAIQATKCLAVLTNASGEWGGLERSKTLNIEINAVTFSFRIFREDLSDNEKSEIRTEWKEKKYHVLIYSTHIETISFFFERSVTSSVCLFIPHADIIEKLLAKCDIRNQLYFYYCVREYIESDFELFNKYIKNGNDNVIPEPLLLDRFQFSQELQHNIEEEVFRCAITAENYCGIICKNRPNAILKNLDDITMIHTEDEFGYYKRKQNFLGEGIYQFFKLLISKGVNRKKDYEGIAFEFINLQAIRILEIYSDNQIVNIFNGKTRDSIIKELIAFGKNTLQRVEALYINGILIGTSNDLISNKEKSIFPDDDEFFAAIRIMPEFFVNSKSFLSLYDLLEYKPKNNYRKLFISYSFKDSKFANVLFERLKLQGVDVKIYEQDNPVVFNKSYMHTSIAETDRMMFIASQYSLTSDPCHYELSQCFEYIRKTSDSTRLIVARVDNYVLNTDLTGVVDNQRIQNINFLRQYSSIQNVSELSNIKSLRAIDEWLIQIVNKSLVINGQKNISKNGKDKK